MNHNPAHANVVWYQFGPADVIYIPIIEGTPFHRHWVLSPGQVTVSNDVKNGWYFVPREEVDSDGQKILTIMPLAVESRPQRVTKFLPGSAKKLGEDIQTEFSGTMTGPFHLRHTIFGETWLLEHDPELDRGFVYLLNPSAIGSNRLLAGFSSLEKAKKSIDTFCTDQFDWMFCPDRQSVEEYLLAMWADRGERVPLFNDDLDGLGNLLYTYQHQIHRAQEDHKFKILTTVLARLQIVVIRQGLEGISHLSQDSDVRLAIIEYYSITCGDNAKANCEKLVDNFFQNHNPTCRDIYRRYRKYRNTSIAHLPHKEFQMSSSDLNSLIILVRTTRRFFLYEDAGIPEDRRNYDTSVGNIVL